MEPVTLTVLPRSGRNDSLFHVSLRSGQNVYAVILSAAKDPEEL